MWNGVFPYKYIWAVGCFLIVLGLVGLLTISGWVGAGIGAMVVGGITVALGFVERGRGAPPV